MIALSPPGWSYAHLLGTVAVAMASSRHPSESAPPSWLRASPGRPTAARRVARELVRRPAQRTPRANGRPGSPLLRLPSLRLSQGRAGSGVELIKPLLFSSLVGRLARRRFRRPTAPRRKEGAGRRPPASSRPFAPRLVRIANRANREAPKRGDSRRIARRSINSRTPQIVI